MPCDQIRYQALELKAADFDLLKKALEGMGARISNATTDTVQFNYKGCSATADRRSGIIVAREGGESMVNRIREAYSSQVVKAAANRYGWSLRQVGSKFTITRR